MRNFMKRHSWWSYIGMFYNEGPRIPPCYPEPRFSREELYRSLKLKVGGTAKVPQLRRFCFVMRIEH